MFRLASISTLAFVAAAGIALAAGTGTTGTAPTSAPKPQLTCKKGEMVKKVSGVAKCVKIKKGELDDESLYGQGVELAKAGEYDWALEMLGAIQNQNDPRVLNYTGYSNRKAGRIDVGIGYYKKALAIDPNFVLAREYLGEGYIVAGKVELAKAELTEIGNRCGTTCEEYVDLNKAIQSGVIEN
jgi:tetratricopeptide (TPR) repeat protein